MKEKVSILIRVVQTQQKPRLYLCRAQCLRHSVGVFSKTSLSHGCQVSSASFMPWSRTHLGTEHARRQILIALETLILNF